MRGVLGLSLPLLFAVGVASCAGPGGAIAGPGGAIAGVDAAFVGKGPSRTRPLVLAIHPVFDRQRQQAMFAPLAERLGRRIGREVRLSLIPSFASLRNAFVAGRCAMAIVASPAAERLLDDVLSGARIVASAVVDRRTRHRAVLLARRDVAPGRWPAGDLAWGPRPSASLGRLDEELARIHGEAWRVRRRRCFSGHDEALRALVRGRFVWGAVAERAWERAGGDALPLKILHRGPWCRYDAFFLNDRLSPSLIASVTVTILSEDGLVPETRELLEWQRSNRALYLAP